NPRTCDCCRLGRFDDSDFGNESFCGKLQWSGTGQGRSQRGDSHIVPGWNTRDLHTRWHAPGSLASGRKGFLQAGIPPALGTLACTACAPVETPAPSTRQPKPLRNQPLPCSGEERPERLFLLCKPDRLCYTLPARERFASPVPR